LPLPAFVDVAASYCVAASKTGGLDCLCTRSVGSVSFAFVGARVTRSAQHEAGQDRTGQAGSCFTPTRGDLLLRAREGSHDLCAVWRAVVVAPTGSAAFTAEAPP
jgi:hypothetical protein